MIDRLSRASLQSCVQVKKVATANKIEDFSVSHYADSKKTNSFVSLLLRLGSNVAC